MDIAAQNNLPSYQLHERSLDVRAGNLAARINADISDFPAVNLRRDYGTIQLLPDTQSLLAAITVTSCLSGGSVPTGTPGNGYTTVYTTQYVQVCPTATPCPHGTTTSTYTITETCSGNPAGYTAPVVPPGFTTAVTVCGACQGKPTLTVTVPVTPTGTSQGGSSGAGGSSSGGAGTSSGTGGNTGTGVGVITSGASSNNFAISASVLFGGAVALTAWLL